MKNYMIIFDLDNTLIDTKLAKVRDPISGTEYSSEIYNGLESSANINSNSLDYSDFDREDLLVREKLLPVFEIFRTVNDYHPGSCHIITGRHNREAIGKWAKYHGADISLDQIHCPEYRESISEFKYNEIARLIKNNPEIEDFLVFEDNENYASSMIRAIIDHNRNGAWINPNFRILNDLLKKIP